MLEAALVVYTEKGYAATEIGEVAERAGLARGLIYHYFKSKQSLLRELYEYMMDKTERFTRSHFEQEDSAAELFRSYACKVCRQVLEEPVSSRFYMRISLDVHYLYEGEAYSPFEWVNRFLQPMIRAIEKGIAQKTLRGGDSRLMAMQFWGAVSQGMHYLERLQQDGTQTNEHMEAVLEQIVASAVAVIGIESSGIQSNITKE